MRVPAQSRAMPNVLNAGNLIKQLIWTRVTRNGVAIIHESRDDASREPEYPVPLGTVDLQARQPQNLNPKMKEMIAVEVDRTGGMMPSPADRNPGPVTGHFRYRRSSAPIQATGAPGPIGKRWATRQELFPTRPRLRSVSPGWQINESTARPGGHAVARPPRWRTIGLMPMKVREVI